jgi:DNA-binding beta-propeller fold protein YncE
MTQILRSKRRKGLTLALVAALSSAGALTILGTFGAHGAAPRTGPLTVHTGLENPPGAFVRGNGLFAKGGRSQLAAAVSGAMIGPLSSVAVLSPDGQLVAYNTWQELRTVDSEQSFSKQAIADGDALGTPSLRVHDDSGKDSLLERGAYSAAWRQDGAIAFVKGVDPEFRAGRRYDGQVVVRPGIHGHDAVWTREPAHYVVYAWAGNRLLFYRVGLGERLELLVADAPGSIRSLADGSAIALSPDATRVAVLSQDATNVRVLDIATGSELAWLDVTTATPPLAWLAYSGSWVADHIVAPANAGLAVLHVGSRSLELEQVLSLDHAQFPVGVQEPRFVDADGNEIAAAADIPPAKGNAAVSFLLVCDRVVRSCDRGEPAPAKEWLRLVDRTPAANEGGH